MRYVALVLAVLPAAARGSEPVTMIAETVRCVFDRSPPSCVDRNGDGLRTSVADIVFVQRWLARPSDLTLQAAGAAVATAQVLRTMAVAWSPLLSQFNFGGGSAATTTFEIPCDNGAAAITCEQETGPDGFTPPVYEATFTACTPSPLSDGRTVTVDGSARLSDQGANGCFSDAPTRAVLRFANLRVVLAAASGAPLITVTLDLSADADITGQGDQGITGLDLTMSGMAQSSGPVGEIQLGFDATSAGIQLAEFDSHSNVYIAQKFAVTLNGAFTLTRGEATLSGRFDHVVFHDQQSGDGDVIDVAGSIQSDCWGSAPMQLAMPAQPLTLPAAAACPNAGEVVISQTQTDTIEFLPGGALQLKIPNNLVETIASCVDPRLFACRAGP